MSTCKKWKHLICSGLILSSMPLLQAADVGDGYVLYDFTGITTAWDKLQKAAPASTNTFAEGITASDFTITTTSGRENAIIGGQAKAKCSSSGFETHTFSITIPKLGGHTVTLTNLTFDFDTRNYDFSLPSATNPAEWTLALSQGSASKTNDIPTSKALHNESIDLSGLNKLQETTVTFTIRNLSNGNNLSTGFFTAFDNVRLSGEVHLPPGTVISFF